MPGHDPQRTYRSPNAVASSPHLLVKRKGVVVSLYALSRMVGFDARGRLTAFNAQGSAVAHYATRDGLAVVRRDGVVVAMGADSGKVEAFAPTGRLLWKHTHIGLPKSALPLATASGTVYAPFEGIRDGSGIEAFSPSGARRSIWQLSTFAVALGSGGDLYAGAWDVESNDFELEAFADTGQLLWSHSLGQGQSVAPTCLCVMVADGRVYAASLDQLRAFDQHGSLLWTFSKPDRLVTLAQRADGTVLVGGMRTLDAISPAGALLWSARISSTHASVHGPTLVLDGRSIAYVGTQDGRVLIISASGARMGSLYGGGYHYGLAPGLLIGPNGRLVVSGSDATLRVYG